MVLPVIGGHHARALHQEEVIAALAGPDGFGAEMTNEILEQFRVKPGQVHHVRLRRQWGGSQHGRQIARPALPFVLGKFDPS